MFGKTGLNNKLRGLLAKIQKEFDFPKVYAVRCTIQSNLRTYEDPAQVEIHKFPELQAMVWPLQTEFPVNPQKGTLEETTTRTVQPMSEIETSVTDVTCWQQASFAINEPVVLFEEPSTRELDHGFRPAAVHSLKISVNEARIKKQPLIQRTWLRTRLAAVRFMPFRMRVYDMKELNKRLIIRYRAAVMKNLGLKPTQIKFVGVVFGLPKMPLKLIKYDKETADGYDYVEARPTGAQNIHLGDRVWVIIRRVDDPRYLPVTLREE